MFLSWGRIAAPVTGQKTGWYFLGLDTDFSAYYKWLYSRAFRGWSLPMNGCHITFIAGEKDDRIISHSEIVPYLDQDIKFWYSNQVYTNGRAFWLPVFSFDLDCIRQDLGLTPRISYHITLGNTKNGCSNNAN